MKNKKLKKILAMASLTALVLAVAGGPAYAEDYGYEDGTVFGAAEAADYCFVDEDFYDLTLNTVWLALISFNEPTEYQFCREHIDFRTGLEVGVRTEILLKGNSGAVNFAFGPRITGQNDTLGASREMAEGDRPVFDSERTYFNMRDNYDMGDYELLYPGAPAPHSDPCAIRSNVSGAAFQNLMIDGNNDLYTRSGGDTEAAGEGVEVAEASGGVQINGLCIEGNNSIIRNVQIVEMSGAGIVIGANVTQPPRFEGIFTEIAGNMGNGIEVRGSSSAFRQINLTGVRVSATNFPYIIKTPTDAYIDSDRLLVIPAEDEIEGADGAMITTRTWEITGVVTTCDTSVMDIGDGLPTPKDPGCTAETAMQKRISALKLFYVDGEGDTYTLDERSTDAEGLMGGQFNEGEFVIIVTEEEIKAKMMAAGIPSPAISATPRMFIMAIDAQSGNPGSTSNIFTLVYNEGTGGGGVSSPDIHIGPTGAALKYSNPFECSQAAERNLHFLDFDRDADTDRDMIKDKVEMMISMDTQRHVYLKRHGGCAVDDNISFWHMTDTDSDGIPDGRELRCGPGTPMEGAALSNIDLQRQVVQDRKVCGLETNSEGIVMMRDSDTPATGVFMDSDAGTPAADGNPDVNDPDSDGDGLMDWEEDRAKLYRGMRRYAYYYEAYGGDNNSAFSMPGDATSRPVICYDPQVDSAVAGEGETEGSRPGEDQLINAYTPSKGVSYSLMIVPYAAGYDLRPHSYAAVLELEAADIVFDIRALKCLSTALVATTNFDGDFNGADCADHTDAESNECSTRCVTNEIKQQIYDANNEFTDVINQTLFDEDDDGIPNLFDYVLEGTLEAQRLNDICGDFDQDGIPNCVEAAIANGSYEDIGSCPDNYRQPGDNLSVYALNPYLADSDGEGGGDGWMSPQADPCPMRADNQCDPYDMCSRFPIIAFYVDRDGDRLLDVDEFGGIEAMEAANCIPRPGLGHSDPLSGDSDGDGLNDRIEWDIETDRTDRDTDGDFLSDGEEVCADGNCTEITGALDIKLGTSYSCDNYNIDTDPTVKDTDGDGLDDGVEVRYLGTSPSDIDSDNDDLCDGKVAVTLTVDGSEIDSCIGFELMNLPDSEEYEIAHYETNPCLKNTDGDEWTDGEEFDNFTCGNDADQTCVGIDPEMLGGTGGLEDSDNDGLPTSMELVYTTNPAEKDTDGDGLDDGCSPVTHTGELCNLKRDGWSSSINTYYNNCSAPDFLDCDTDPNDDDSDDDGLNDKLERDYPTNPWRADTDGDCIDDGLEDRDRNGQHDSDETLAASDLTVVGNSEDMFEAIDTDGDGIPDGNAQQYSQYGCEDCDCNGEITFDANGNQQELNPLSVDSDGDGIDDWTEMTAGGGFFDRSRLGEALSARRGGCSIVTGAGADWSMIAIFAGLILLAIHVRRRVSV